MVESHLNRPSIKHRLLKLSKKLKRIAIKSYKVTKGTTLFLIGPARKYKRQKRKKATELARNQELGRTFIEDGNMHDGENNPSGQETIEMKLASLPGLFNLPKLLGAIELAISLVLATVALLDLYDVTMAPFVRLGNLLSQKVWGLVGFGKRMGLLNLQKIQEIENYD
ncbi:hypothetical protein P167DRAFT_532737 [Morchella conica CCBAS932]|uniref:Uncharacterized protein n=1 Tax=Morchella conica CCBAS932 TaxID=1392247 RepID=A0A3N4L248_9PEZI|nr:hypothetical protein P167DRAFT_532737 [Morchella conica CCBAS932]